MERKALLDCLFSLVEHPSTPIFERLSAQSRIDELMSKGSVDSGVGRKDGRRWLCVAKARCASARSRRVHSVRWPFGWSGVRGPVENSVERDASGGISVKWKCPRCGAETGRNLSSRDVLSLVVCGDSSRLDAVIGKMVNGRQNQLCIDCTEFLSSHLDT